MDSPFGNTMSDGREAPNLCGFGGPLGDPCLPPTKRTFRRIGRRAEGPPLGDGVTAPCPGTPCSAANYCSDGRPAALAPNLSGRRELPPHHPDAAAASPLGNAMSTQTGLGQASAQPLEAALTSPHSRLFTSTGPSEAAWGCIAGCQKRIALGGRSLLVDGIAARPYLELPGGATRLAANKGQAGIFEMLMCIMVKGYTPTANGIGKHTFLDVVIAMGGGVDPLDEEVVVDYLKQHFQASAWCYCQPQGYDTYDLTDVMIMGKMQCIPTAASRRRKRRRPSHSMAVKARGGFPSAPLKSS